MKYSVRIFTMLFAATLIVSNAVYAEPLAAASTPGKLRFSAGYYYGSGDYGTQDDTKMDYTPFTIEYRKSAWKLALTLAYIRINGPDYDQPLNESDSGAKTKRVTNSGVGDTLLSFYYSHYYNPQNQFYFGSKFKIKLATADEDKYLGTGADDYYFQLLTSKTFTDITIFSSIGYKWIGDTETTNYSNVPYGYIGGMLELSNVLSGGLTYYNRDNTRPTNVNQKNTTLFVTYKPNNKWILETYTLRGHSDSSQSWGIGTNLKYNF